jgi:hypothetical protein
VDQAGATTGGTYELVVRSQAGAEELLREPGALREIEAAVLAHCAATAPEPPYKPQAYKKELSAYGWLPEVRVPPYAPERDDWPINERYDAFKFFQRDGEEVGVAIEMEGWEINNDLLRFRRGFSRGQIVAGVLLQPHYYDLFYCFEHKLHLNEPLFTGIPIAFVCPRGPGLKEPKTVRTPKYGPYLMPRKKGGGDA